MSNSNGRASAVARQAQKSRAHGANAKCKDCGEKDPLVLVARSRPKRCQECYQRSRAKTIYEDHHPAGRANSKFTVRLPANSHRRVSDDQVDWDDETLRNPLGCPLRAAAAWIRGFVATLKEMAERFLLSIAELLEIASDWLLLTSGDGWWRGTPLERFTVVLGC